MRSDENSDVYGDVRSATHAASTSPAGTPGASATNREDRLKSRDELTREVEVLGGRIATLSAAVLRLGSSLDLATVLQEAADSAHTLTHARYSLIVTVDEACELVTASGRRRRSTATRGASAQAGEHHKSRGAARVRPGVRHCPICSRPTPAYRAALLEQVVARAGGDGRRTLDVRQRELRQQFVHVVLPRPVLEASIGTCGPTPRPPPCATPASSPRCPSSPSHACPGTPARRGSPCARRPARRAPAATTARGETSRSSSPPAGLTHTAPSRSNCSHVARRTSTCRDAVSAVNRIARFVEGAQFVASILASAPQTSEKCSAS